MSCRNCSSCSKDHQKKTAEEKSANIKNSGLVVRTSNKMGGLSITTDSLEEAELLLGILEEVAFCYEELDVATHLFILRTDLEFYEEPIDCRVDGMSSLSTRRSFCSVDGSLFEEVSISYSYLDGLKIIFYPCYDFNTVLILSKMSEFFEYNNDLKTASLFKTISFCLSRGGFYTN